MEEVLKKVATLAVTGGNAMIRIHCRQVRTPTPPLCLLAQSFSSGVFLRAADLPEVPAGLPAGEEAEQTHGLRGGAAAVRTRHRQGVRAGNVGVHHPDVPSGVETQTYYVKSLKDDFLLRSFVFSSVQKLLFRYSSLFFAPLALVTVNDDSARCKKMAAMAIKTLLSHLDLNHQNTLFSFVNTWLNSEKVCSSSDDS